MLKKKWFRFAVMVVIVCAVVFILMNGAGFLSDKILTVRPEVIVSAEYINAPAAFIREEKVITQSGESVVSYEANDGERVRTDTVIAKLYAAGADVAAAVKLDALSEKTAALKALASGETTHRHDAIALEEDINALILEMTALAGSGDYADIPSLSDRLTYYFNIKQLLLNETEGFDKKIAEYEAEITALKKTAPKAEKTLKAGAVGTFTSKCDGFEGVFTYSKLTSLTVTEAAALIKDAEPEKRPDGYIGKVIDDYSWHVAAVLDDKTARDYPVGTQLRITTAADRDGAHYNAEVIYNQSFRGEAVVILEGAFGTEIFADMRKTEIKILKSAETVLSVPSSALLQNEEGVTGVYVLVGQQVVFKPAVFVKYEGDRAYIKSPSSSSSAISQFDEVIYSGKNLFDGKVV